MTAPIRNVVGKFRAYTNVDKTGPRHSRYFETDLKRAPVTKHDGAVRMDQREDDKP